MSTSTPDIQRPGRVRAARDLRALTQREVVARMRRPITPAALSQIESGKVRASQATLADLALALEVPERFFGADWSASSTDDVMARVTYFRDLAATPAKERRRAAAMTLLLSDLIGALENYVRLPDVDLASYSAGPSSSREDIEDIAQAVRGEWGLGDSEPIPNVVRAIERHGVPVARFELGSNHVSAFSVRLTRRPLVMLASDKNNYVRSRFDASHELGHLLMHESADSSDRRIENQAHAFAASFLLPRDVAEDLLPRKMDALSWSQLAEAKRDWGISIGALLYRSNELGILNADRYRSAMKYLSARGWRRTEPGDREMGAAEAPTLIEAAFRQATEVAELSFEDFIEHAHLPISDTLALLRAAKDERPRISF